MTGEGACYNRQGVGETSAASAGNSGPYAATAPGINSDRIPATRWDTGLATQHLAKHETGTAWLSHDELVGIIDYDVDSDEAVIQVDGEALTMGQLATILRGHEGFEVRLQIVEQV